MEPTSQPTEGGSASGKSRVAPTEQTLDDTEAAPDPGPTPARLDRGDEVGRYVVLAQLGAGGMGMVYAAYDPELDRKVALKVLHPRRAASSQADVGQARLLREAQSLAQLTHPNVITVHDVGTFRGSVFVAMEFIDGRTLTDWYSKKERPWARVLEVAQLAGRGLIAAHERGLVHRDFKPDNVMVSRSGRVVVLDFGLARQEAEYETGARRVIPINEIGSVDGDDDDDDAFETFDDASVRNSASAKLPSSLTRTHGVMGTPAYMSPEQHLGLGADARSDQFAFCVVLYEALYQHRPFDGESRTALALSASEGKVKLPPTDTDVPSWLHRVLLRGLASDPEGRFPNMEALLAELNRVPSERPRRRWLVPAAGAAGLTLAFYAMAAGDDATTRVCQSPERHLANVWDDETAESISNAFEGTGLPFAPRVFDQVRAELDDYAVSWQQMRQETCEATHLHGEQSAALLDRRMLCLDRSLTQLGALTEQLVQADPEMMERSVSALASLPPLARCADLAALMSDEEPLDGDARDAVDQFEQHYATARAKLATGSNENCKEAVARALEYARSIEHAESLARALLLDAAVKLEDKQHTAAQSSLYEALASSDRAGNHRLRAEATIALISLVGATQARAREGRDWATVAKAAVEQAGDEPALRAEMASALGRVYLREDRFDEAEAHFEDAVEIRRDAFGPDDLSVLDAQHDAARVARERGELDRALEQFEQATAILGDKLGDSHPRVAQELRATAEVLFDLNRYADALDRLERVTAIYGQRYGQDHPKMADLLSQRATVLDYAGQSAEALTLYERQLEIVEATAEQGSLETAAPHMSLGNVLHTMRRLEPSREHYRKALAIQERHLGEGHAEVGRTLMDIGRTHYFEDDFDLALNYYERSVEIWESKLGPDHLLMGFVYVNMADVFEYQRDWEACIEYNERGLARYAPAYGAEHGQIAYALGGICRCLVGKGEPAQAEPVCRRGLEMQEAFRIEQADAARIELGLARALESSDHAAALRHGTHALEAFRGELPQGAREIGEAERWLARAGR